LVAQTNGLVVQPLACCKSKNLIRLSFAILPSSPDPPFGAASMVSAAR
jgi:hypothetical protein